jgi:hypothetical protein
LARDVDEKKTRKALRKLKRAAERATEAGGPGLTDWEKQFVEGVSTRLETYGSAFRDPGKGSLDEALSERQTHIVRAIDKKGRKARAAVEPQADGAAPRPQRPHSSFKPKGPPQRSAGRDIRADAPPALKVVPATAAPPAAPEPAKPRKSALKPAARRPALHVIPGGRPRGGGV